MRLSTRLSLARVTPVCLGGTITSWNAAVERLFGHGADAAVGRPIDIIVPEARLLPVEVVGDLAAYHRDRMIPTTPTGAPERAMVGDNPMASDPDEPRN